jgi:hypothetical protein
VFIQKKTPETAASGVQYHSSIAVKSRLRQRLWRV